MVQDNENILLIVHSKVFGSPLSLSIMVIAILYNSRFIIEAQHDIEPELAEKAIDLFMPLWGAPGCLYYQVLRSQCEGLSKTKPGMIIGFVGLLINILSTTPLFMVNWRTTIRGVLVVGVATASVFWAMFLMMRYYVRRAPTQRDVMPKKRLVSPDFTR